MISSYCLCPSKHYWLLFLITSFACALPASRQPVALWCLNGSACHSICSSQPHVEKNNLQMWVPLVCASLLPHRFLHLFSSYHLSVPNWSVRSAALTLLDLTVSWIIPACPLIVLLSHKKIKTFISKCWHFPPATLNIRSLYIYTYIYTYLYFSLFPRRFWIWTKFCSTTIHGSIRAVTLGPSRFIFLHRGA